MVHCLFGFFFFNVKWEGIYAQFMLLVTLSILYAFGKVVIVIKAIEVSGV